MEILFVRHGQTYWNCEGKIQGKTDIELNDKGKEQANITCSLLDSENIDLIVSSPLQRALQTAKVIAKKKKVPIVIDDLLRERDYGEFEGHYFSEVDFSGIWYEGSKEPNGIEPLRSFCERVKTAFVKIKETYDGKKVLVVSHGGVSVAASILVNNTPQNKDSKELYIDNCKIARYDISRL